MITFSLLSGTGYPALRNAIVEKLKKENGLEYTAAQIHVQMVPNNRFAMLYWYW